MNFYKTEFSERAEYRFQVEQFLREAIEKHQLSLVYQPQIHIDSGEIIGVEVLSRWSHSQQGDISPSHFLDKDIISLVKSVIEETGMIPTELELEVTENVVQTDPKNLSVFQKLKELGILLAIDDFGRGYSSFASLKHLKVDYLKIDRYFINDMLNDDKTHLLMSSMVEMGHNLGYKIIAEGVDTSEQLHLLKTLDCEMAQGYFFSQPVCASEMSKMLKTGFS